MNTDIPVMTHPLSKAWDQPALENVKFLFGKAWVSKDDFEKLKEYSCTNPSGVYAGKMWKSEVMIKSKCDGKRRPKWFLKWYTDSKKEGFCDVNMIELQIE